ncbi:hypothetical protein WUBG_14156, partial [Wuchereria bancrofti]
SVDDALLIRIKENSQKSNEDIATIADINMSRKCEAFIIDGPTEFLDQAVPTTVMNKCVPTECTSSPIVDILASTAMDRPKPPPNFKVGIGRMKKSTAVQCDRRTNSSKDKRKSKFVE